MQLRIFIAQELSLSCCAVSRDDQLTHVIKALNACVMYFPKDALDRPLHKVCKWLAPGDFLADGSIFASSGNNDAKTKSLRAFLCEAVVENVPRIKNKEEIDEFFELLRELKTDLFNKENLQFFESQIRIKIYENQLVTGYSEGKLLEESKKISLEIPEVLKNGEELNGNVDTFDDNNKETNGSSCGSIIDLENKIESDVSLENSESKLECLEEKSMTLFQKIAELSRLKQEVMLFEKERIIVPNPAFSRLKLRDVLSNLPQDLAEMCTLKINEETNNLLPSI